MPVTSGEVSHASPSDRGRFPPHRVSAHVWDDLTLLSVENNSKHRAVNKESGHRKCHPFSFSRKPRLYVPLFSGYLWF